MSAFVVGKTHIDALVTAAMSLEPGEHRSGLHWWAGDPCSVGESAETTEEYFAGLDRIRRELSVLDHQRASEVGRMLWLENFKSIWYRYPDTQDGGPVPGPVTTPAPLLYNWESLTLKPVSVLKAINCLLVPVLPAPGLGHQ